MSSRRTAILIGAIAIGVVAVLLIVQYVRGIEQSALGDSEPVSVFVAKNLIPRGTDGTVADQSGDIEAAQIPRKFYPNTAIQTPDAVKKKVALFNIAPGTVIVDGMFVDQATTQISFRQRLKNPNHVAISVRLDPVRGVGGFLQPGDEVNMMIFQDNTKVKQAVESPDANTKNLLLAAFEGTVQPKDARNFVNTGGAQWIILDKTARYLYQKVQILAVGQNQLLTPGEQAGEKGTAAAAGNDTSLITFNVPPVAAQWIASGTEAGFYLSLVAKEYAPSPLPPLPIIVDVLPGEDPGKLTPYFADQG